LDRPLTRLVEYRDEPPRKRWLVHVSTEGLRRIVRLTVAVLLVVAVHRGVTPWQLALLASSIDGLCSWGRGR